MDKVFYWTGGAVWAMIACIAVWLGFEIIMGAVASASWVRWANKSAKVHRRKLAWYAPALSFLFRWPGFIGWRNSRAETWTTNEGVWEGIGKWKVYPACAAQPHTPMPTNEKPLLPWLAQDKPGQALQDEFNSGRLAQELPEVAKLYGVPQRAEHHPEVDTGRHIELCLDAAVRLGASPAARFAVLVHDLGKGLTDPAKWPAHVDHETTGLPLVEDVCRRLNVPEDWATLAKLVCVKHLNAHRAMELRAQTVITLLGEPALQDMTVLTDFLVACESDARGRLGFHDRDYPQREYLERSSTALRAQGPEPTRDSVEWQDWHRARLTAVRAVHADITQRKAVPQATC